MKLVQGPIPRAVVKQEKMLSKLCGVVWLSASFNEQDFSVLSKFVLLTIFLE